MLVKTDIINELVKQKAKSLIFFIKNILKIIYTTKI